MEIDASKCDLVDSDVRIIDFGIALVADSEISRIEGIAGSPSYMSPEQVQSIELTNRSDLYSLGAVMYELLTGTRPFRAGNLQKLLHQIVFATPPPIHTLRPEIPEDLENVTAMALQKDPAKRYKTGLDFAAELTRVHEPAYVHAACSGTLDARVFYSAFKHPVIDDISRDVDVRVLPIDRRVLGAIQERHHFLKTTTINF